MLQSGNFLRDIPPRGSQEAFEDLLWGKGFRVERIISQGHASPEGFWYQQVEAEWVIVLEGAGRLEFQDGSVHPMARGDYLHLPAGLPHRVQWTDPDTPTIWLAIHFPSQV